MIVGIVGYRFEYYPYTRNIVGIVPEAEYKKTNDLFAQGNRMVHRLNRLATREIFSPFDLNNQFCDFNLNKVDLLHFFNGISYNRTPWVSTFETILPRFKNIVRGHHGEAPGFSGFANVWKVRKAFEALAGPACKRIIALSKCGANMQRELLLDFSDYAESIERKLIVMHPPQNALVSHFSDKQLDMDGKIKFMFVGGAFFRKGGMEIVETLESLRKKHNYDIELTIVSSLRIDSYAANERPEDIRRAEQLIRANDDWITHFSQLPNPEVLRFMKESHVGLLPTYADTYGYSVLEFQAAGCPVISTNVRALPEINDNKKGWLIEVPKNRLGEAIYTTDEDRVALSNAIQTGLEQVIHHIFSDRSLVPMKSEKAISSIKENHSLQRYSAQMREIYIEAM